MATRSFEAPSYRARDVGHDRDFNKNASEIRSFTGPKLLPRGLLPFCSALKLKMTVETSFAWTAVAAEEASSFFPLLFSKDGEDRRTDGRMDGRTDGVTTRPPNGQSVGR